MIWVLFALFSMSVYPQAVELSSVVHSVVSGYTINYQMLDRQLSGKGDLAYREAQKKWRLSIHLEYLTAVGVGVSIALENNGRQWYRYGYDVIEAFAIREALRPIFYNLFGGRAWNKQPNTDWTYFSVWEKSWNTYTRLLFAGMLVAIKFLLL